MRSPRYIEGDWWSEPLPENFVFGRNTHLETGFSFLHHRSNRDPAIVVGHDSGIYQGTFFDLGPNGHVRIGNWCTIAGGIFSTNGSVIIGDHCLMSYGVVVADSHFAAPPGAGGTGRSSQDIVIGNNVWISAGVTVLAGAVVGEGAILGAGSVVTTEVPPFGIIAGEPARVVGWAKEQPE